MQTTRSRTTEMQHVNYESDFRVVFSFPEDKVPDYPWEIELSTPNTPAYNAFVASFDGENYHNCSMQSDTELLVAVDNHKLQPGILSYKFKIKAPDAAFPDGVMNVTTPGQLGIELWAGPSDEFEHEGVNVIVLPLKGDTGEPGKSAYELFKEFNPDSELTEEQYAEAPVQAAEAALAMVEQLEKTDAAVKQAEQLREQAEQGREASERARAAAEQTRVTAEQQRVLAEQTRATNESTRQTAEAGRQAAETKREENTAEAIRNSEEATRKAEDEAARVRTLADNPPKIVEVNGMAYWAFYDLETEQYVTSQHRADDGTIVQQVEGADVSLDVVGGTMYVCGELTSLTIASVDNSTKPSIIRFTSGATATQFSYPENFNITGWTKPEENRYYTICILFGAGNMTYDE